MNLFNKSKFPGCVKHCGEEIICGPPPLMVEQRFFCGPSSSSSSTAQSAQNQQVALQTASGGPGVAVGAGGSAGAIAVTSTTDSGNTVVSGDTLTAAEALVLANNTITQDQAAGLETQSANVGLAETAIQSAQDQAAQSITAMGHQSDQVDALAANLGGAAINLAGDVTNEAFNFAQNESVLNYNALNQNTALAFSTIAALSTADAAGAISANAADLARLAGQIGTQSGGATTVVVPAATTAPYTAADTSTGGVSAGTLTMIGIVLAALYFLFPKGAKQLTG